MASAAMELKVLINILTQGQAMPQLLAQIKQVSAGLTQLQTAGSGSKTGVDQVSALATAAEKAAAGVTGLGRASVATAPNLVSLEGAVNKVIRAVKFLSGGFLAFESVRFIKGLADAAARTEVLETVLHVAARNAGIAADEIDEVSKKVQRLGITSDAASQSLTQLMQAGLDIKFAAPLARAAQDLAVIADSDSSATFERMITAIQTLNTMTLRRMGIVVQMTQAEARYRREHEDIIGPLNNRQRQEALTNEVLLKSLALQGTYEGAMGNVGKQLTSLVRLFSELRSEIGKQLLPAYSALISELSLFLERITDIVRAGNANMDWAQRMGEYVRVMARRFFEAVEFLVRHRKAIEALTIAYGTYWAMVAGKAIFAHMVVVVEALTGSVIGSVRAIRRATAATLEWAAAVGVLKSAQGGVGGAAAGAEGAVEGAVVGTVAGAAGGAATGAVEASALVTTGKWLLQYGKVLIGWLGELAASLVTAAEAAGLFALLMDPLTWIIGGIVAVCGGLALIMMRLGGVTDQVGETFKLLGGIFGSVGRLLKDVVIAGWIKLTELIDKGIGKVKALYNEMKGWEAVLESMPGNPIKQARIAFDWLNGVLDTTKKKIDENIERLEKMFNIQPPDESKSAAYAELMGVATKEGEQRQAITDIKTKRGLATKQYGTGSSQEQAVDAELKAANAELAKTQAREAELEKKLSPDAVSHIKEQVAYNKVLKERNDILDASEDAAKGLNKVLVDGKLVPKDFAEQTTALKSMIDGLETYQKILKDAKAGKGAPGQVVTEAMVADAQQDVNEAQLKVFQKASEAGLTVTDTVTRDMFRAQTARVASVATTAQAGMLNALGQAIDAQISKHIEPAYQEQEAARIERFKKTESATAAFLAAQLQMTRTANTQLAKEDEESLANSAIDNQEFNDRAKARRAADIKDELAVEANKVLTLVRQRDQEKDPKERDALQGRIAEAQLAFSEKKASLDSDINIMTIEQRMKIAELERSVAEQVANTAAKYGTLGQALEAVNQKYITLNLHSQGDPRKQQALAADKAVEEADVRLKYLERDNALSAEARRLRQSENTDAQNLLDIRKKRTEEDQKEGRISGHDAMVLQRAQQREQTEIDYTNVVLNEEEKRAKIREIGAKRAVVIAEMAAAIVPHGEFSPETQARLLEVLGPTIQAVEELTRKGEELTATWEQGRKKAVEYSKDIQEHFEQGFADALTKSITDFKNAGKVWVSLSKSIADEIVGTFMKAFTERLFQKMGLFTFVDAAMNKIFGSGSTSSGKVNALGGAAPSAADLVFRAEGGPVSGPGTGTSDSIPAMLSAGEHVMPASKAAQWMPLLEGIRLGRLAPAFALGGVVSLQSIASPSVIPRRYAGGGVVIADGGASSVMPGGGGAGNMTVALHPDTLNMTMREWLEHEVVRQYGRR